MPETIIVYRNPLEKMLWESGLAIPFLSGLAVAMVAAFAMSLLIDRMRNVRSQSYYQRSCYQNRYSQRPKRISESTGNLLIVVTAIVSFAAVFIWLM